MKKITYGDVMENNITKLSNSFADWVKQNNHLITLHLHEEGLNFVTEKAQNLKPALGSLILDNRWHYLDKAKKESYRGVLNTDSFGVPHLNLTYYSFRHGGESARFDSRAVIKELWKQSLNGHHSSFLAKRNTQDFLKPLAIKENTPKIDYLLQDEAHWNSLETNGTSHYLSRKNLDNTNIQGIRFAKDHICLKIINQEGVYQGLQKIYNDGTKRFTKGLNKKGHFALIGALSLPEKLSTIHICEGAATAASIHLALNEPVFAALDAFNLYAVSRNLKRKYPRTQIIIWADNDRQKANNRLSNGRLLGNTGLIHANRAAFKLRDALVCTPDFSKLAKLPSLSKLPVLKMLIGIPNVSSSFFMKAVQSLYMMEFIVIGSVMIDVLNHELQIARATDFNDLHTLSNLEEVLSHTPHRPDISLALTHELYKYQRYSLGAISHKQFEKGSRATYDARYLPNISFEEGVHLIKSPIGTGKTAVVETLVKANPNKSVLFTTHLISLVESAAARLDLCSYNLCDTYDLHIESRLAICLNSLGKLTANAPLRDYDIVIIDEIEQVLARLTTDIDQKPLVFSVLMRVMANAKTLICLDAHLSKTTVQLIQAACFKKPVFVHLNQHVSQDMREIVLHDNAESVQLEAMRVLNENKTVFLTFNSKADAFKTFSAINALFPQKKGLYISSDNAGDKENEAFFKDVNKVSKLYDYLVCTPSVSTGVSIDNNHFDFVGGIFLAHVNTANDCMQALGRVRNANVRHVFCEKRYANHPLDENTIAAKWLQTHKHDMQLMNLSNTGARVLMDENYEALCLSVTIARNLSLNDFYQQFALLSLHEGITLTYAKSELDLDTRKQFKEIKQTFMQIEAQSVGLAPVSESIASIRELLNKPRKSMEETRSFKKQQLIEFYRLSSQDTESIQSLANIDNENRFKKCILALELALSDTDNAKNEFLKQTQNFPQFAADVQHFATEQALYKRLLNALYLIKDEGDLLNTADFQYTSDSTRIKEFIEYIEDNRIVLAGIISIPSSQQLKRDPLRFIGTLLTKLGLKQKRVGRSENATYHIDGDRLQLINGILQKRRAGIMGTCIPLNTSSIPAKKITALDTITTCMQRIKDFFTPNPLFALT